MQLEEGIAARNVSDDDRKKPRRQWRHWVAAFGRYERCARVGTLGIFALWVMFLFIYYSSRTPKTARATVAAAGGDANRGRIANPDAHAAAWEVAFPDSTNFLVIGDYGTGDTNQRQVAKGFASFAAALDPPPAFVVSTGDQIYEHG